MTPEPIAPLRADERWPEVRSLAPYGVASPQIDRNARLQLAWALSVGRVTAFVGAGVSMSYGRPGWSTLFRRLADDTIARAKSHEHHADIKQLLADLEQTRKASAGAEYLPHLFQLSERLSQAIGSKAPNADPDKKHDRLRQDLHHFMQEDAEDALLLLRSSHYAAFSKEESYQADWKIFEERWFVNSALDCRDDQEVQVNNFRLRALFSRKAAEAVADEVKAKCADKPCRLADRLLEPLLQACDTEGRLFPLHRFVVPVLLRLAQHAGSTDIWRHLVPASSDAAGRLRIPTGPDTRGHSRADLIPAQRDPLLILLERLRISRFLTTNYDDEIERLFRNRGHRSDGYGKRSHAAHRDAYDALGVPARELVFTPDRGGELVDFAVQDPPPPPHVVHLHGRAERDGTTGRLIVTEQDYQDLYISDHDDRPPVNEAVRLIFAANPILFVGLGMQEDDILRPLRQFMSQRVKADGRLAVALMPMAGNPSDQIVQQAALLQRYGVQAIYYGEATAADGGEARRWLGQVRKVIGLLRGALPDAAGEEDQLDLGHALHDIRKELGGDAGAPPAVSLPTRIEGVDPAEYNDLGCDFEVSLLNACLAAVSAAGADSALLREIGEARDMLRFMLEQIESSILSVCLCACLVRLQSEALAWREAWFRVPAPRRAGMTGQPSPAGGHPFLPWDKFRFLCRQTQELAVRPNWEARRRTPDRFFGGVVGRSLHLFLEGMRDIDARDLARYQGRRLFLLITPRGTGKGHLFDSLNDDDSLRNVALATWGRRAEPEGARVPAMPCYAGAALLSLSFSNEIVSVFDRLAAFLADCFPRVADREIARQREWEELQKNRIGCLRFAMNEYTKFKNDPENVRRGTNRLLVVINGINKMFDRNGIAKNTQFFHLFESVVQEAYAAAPIDFVFISSDESIPRQFRSLSSTARIGTLAQPIR